MACTSPNQCVFNVRSMNSPKDLSMKKVTFWLLMSKSNKWRVSLKREIWMWKLCAQMSYKKRRPKSRSTLLSRPSTMRDCASTWPRPKMRNLEDRSTCWEKSWPVQTTNAPDIQSRLRKIERRLRMRTGTTKLFQKLPKKPITRSSPSKRSTRKKRKTSKFKFINFKLNSRTKTTF